MRGGFHTRTSYVEIHIAELEAKYKLDCWYKKKKEHTGDWEVYTIFYGKIESQTIIYLNYIFQIWRIIGKLYKKIWQISGGTGHKHINLQGNLETVAKAKKKSS